MMVIKNKTWGCGLGEGLIAIDVDKEVEEIFVKFFFYWCVVQEWTG